MPSSALSLLPPSPPLFPYTRSSDLFVVPRSMPTIRDIAFLVLSEGIGQVVDHRAEVRADRQRFLHRREAALPRRGRRSVPVLAERPRSEEHTSELQSLTTLVCRLLLYLFCLRPLHSFPTRALPICSWSRGQCRRFVT